MKKIIFTFVLSLILPLGLFAGLKYDNRVGHNNATNDYTVKPFDASQYFSQSKDAPSEQILDFKNIIRFNDIGYMLYARVTPFAYEPISKTLVMVQSDIATVNNAFVDKVNIWTSQDQGATWTKREVFNQTGKLVLWPSIGVHNPTGSNNPADFNYLIMGTVADQPQYQFNGAIYIFATKGGNSNYEEYGPNTTSQRWPMTRTTSFADGEEGYIYNAGMLLPAAGQAYGYYGISGFNFYKDQDNFTANAMPPQWDLSKFKASDDPSRSYNAPINISTDPQGSVYALVNNILQVDDQNRLPAVSKSMDAGMTWTEFEPMPLNVLDDYISNNGGLPGFGAMPNQLPYQLDGFTATGPDEFSFVFRIWMTSDGNMYDLFHIVEAYKKNGAWGMRKVADYQGLPFTMVLQNVSDQQGVLKDSLLTNFLGNELQLAKTADGQNLLVKLVQVVDKPIVVTPPFQYIAFDEQQNANVTVTVDTIATTDVFMSYRSKSGDSWSTPVNVTNDDLYNKLTWIPEVIQDIKKVPLIDLNTVKITAANNPRRNYASIIQQLIVDPFYPQDASYATIDATVLPDDVPQTATNVRPVSLKDVYPNPAGGWAEISFTLDNSANTTVELFNAMGQQVEVLQHGLVSSGFHTVNVNTAKLVPGVYYYTLSVNGQKITKSLSVVR